MHRYGWKPDLPDFRDHAFAPTVTALPPKIDLRTNDDPVYDQGQLGSCTANAIAGMFEFITRKLGGSDYVPSRLFIYYGERSIEGTVSQDAGAYIRDGMKVVKNSGAPHETLWPYNISKFKTKPPAKAYTDALSHQAQQYMRISRSLASMKQCLVDGYPFVFGFTVYDSFESSAVAKTGVVPMPQKNEQVLGGHGIMAIGYDDARQSFTVRNSWGSGWGDRGYFYLPYGFFTSAGLSSDFWTLRTVEVSV